MKVMGIGSTVLLLAIAVVFAVVGLKSIPDIKRYIEMRRM
jgi:hypothetical protein